MSSELVVGPLARGFAVHEGEGKQDPERLGPREGRAATLETANARLVLHRTAILGGTHHDQRDDGPIRAWAVDTDLGQRAFTGNTTDRSADLRRAVERRRRAAVAALALGSGLLTRAVELEPQGALVAGTGDAGIRDVGITLHGTYGWPIIPGTALKGVTHAYARDVAGLDEAELTRLFGGPRPGSREDAVQGLVVFADALPGPDGVTVAEHVMTPHTRGYRVSTDGGRTAPAEYLNPVPVPFLAVESGVFVTHLIGIAPELDEVAVLLAAAVDDLGVGAKTSAGYGYLTATGEVT